MFLYASEMCQLLAALLKLYLACRLYAVYIEPSEEYFKCVYSLLCTLSVLYRLIILWSLQVYRVQSTQNTSTQLKICQFQLETDDIRMLKLVHRISSTKIHSILILQFLSARMLYYSHG